MKSRLFLKNSRETPDASKRIISATILHTHGQRRYFFISMARRINIGVKKIKMAIESDSYLNALTLATMLKMSYTNSVMYNWSYRKIMATCHCNFAKAKEILDNGIRSGLIYIQNGHIHARRISQSIGKNAVFHIVYKKGEPQLFMKRSNTYLIKRLHLNHIDLDSPVNYEKLIKFEQYSCDSEHLGMFLNDGHIQTFNDIRRTILKAAILLYLKNWRKLFDVFNHQFGMKGQKAYGEFGRQHTNYLNTGISYQALADRLEGIRMSRYQISNLVQELVKEGLVTSKKSSVRFIDLHWEEEHAPITLNDFKIQNPRLQKTVNMAGQVYPGKLGMVGMYFRRMGNIYELNEAVWKNSRGYNPNKNTVSKTV